MRTVGRLTTLVGAVVGAVMVVVGIRSVPDVKRYLRIREM